MEKEFGKLIVCGGWDSKIGAGTLSDILKKLPEFKDDNLLVGFESSDDAAVYKINDEQAIITTLDFFPTMVSDPYTFGKIAATNSLSDVWAMGGKVLSALNIVAFPDFMDINILGEILRGGAEKVLESGGVLIGGHSIHDSSPKYGLSVTGIVHPDKILKNNSIEEGDVIVITKPLGVGIAVTGYSVGEVSEETYNEAIKSMTTLNKYSSEIMTKYDVHGCTDITGFGLLGHLHEMLDGRFSAEIETSNLPIVSGTLEAAREFLTTAGGQKNRNHFEKYIKFDFDDFAMEEILYDPQTSGGLMFTCSNEQWELMKDEMEKLDTPVVKVGRVVKNGTIEKEIVVKERL